MLNLPPEAILAVLKSASTETPDIHLGAVLEAFRLQWLGIASRRYSSLQADVDDAIQNALLKLISPQKLGTLEDVTRIEGWARSLFVHAVLDLVRDRRRELARRSPAGRPEDDPEQMLRERVPSSSPTPEQLAEEGERLEIVARCIESLEVARLRFIDGLPEKDIAARRGLTRDAVAGQLKRFRKALRNALGDPD